MFSWMFAWPRLFRPKPIWVPHPHKIEVFVRHCLLSKASLHKRRFPQFSREACHHNLLSTSDLNKVNFTFFLDVGQGSKQDHFLKEMPNVVEIRAGSESSSFLQLLDYVEKRQLAPETLIYFLEDDYLHKPGWVDLLLEAFRLQVADYVTLYDHCDKYFFPQYKGLKSEIFMTPSAHWRTIPSTTNTFACRYQTLMRDLSLHRQFSKDRKITADHAKFIALQKRGAVLISSLPGWSTHVEPEFASPCFDWEHLLTHSLKEMDLCPTQKQLL